jgi:hypothetical protein
MVTATRLDNQYSKNAKSKKAIDIGHIVKDYSQALSTQSMSITMYQVTKFLP